MPKAVKFIKTTEPAEADIFNRAQVTKLNSRSERVMQKIGMQKVDEFAHPKIEEGDPLCRHVLYKIEL